MAMLEPLFHWSVPTPYPLSDEVIADARARGLSARLMRVLSRRGPVDSAALAARFDAPESALNDPGLLPDADRARARVADRGRGTANGCWSWATSTPMG